MKILEISQEPLHRIPYMNIGTESRVVTEQLCIYGGTVDELPGCVSGLIIASDLQGRDKRRGASGERRLLGEVLADELRTMSRIGKLPVVDSLGVVLAGDLWARPLESLKRGGSGDVRGVWKAFSNAGFRWTVGVAGNHDVIGEKGPSLPDMHAFLREPGIHFLDGNSVELDGMVVAGVSGVIGNPRRNFRRAESDYVETACRLVEQSCDMLILHEGPAAPGRGLVGCELLTELLEVLPPTLIVRGHKAWDPWFVMLRNGSPVLNVDAKVVVLTSLKEQSEEV